MADEKLKIVDRRRHDAAGNPTPEAIHEDLQEKLRQSILLVEADRTYDPPYPIMDKILVLKSKADTEYVGTSIVIPETARKDPNKGVVVAVSPVLLEHGVPLNGLFVPTHVKVGDVVTFTQFCDETFTVGQDIYALLSIHDVKFVEAVTYVFNPDAVIQ
jgi:co-chaperonin GroES (HSP10)